MSPESTQTIFFDHAAGSPLRPEVANAMAHALVGLPPNPSGAHRLARATRGVLEDAREEIAELLDVDAREVVITGGGTEACNLGIFGVSNPSAICISAIEHVAVREAAIVAASQQGIDLIELPVDPNGVLKIDAAVSLIPNGSLVSVMAANNETGALQPVVELRKALRHAPCEVVVHCDAVAAGSSIALGEIVDACDLVSLAGHKLGGPPSCGVLIVKSGTALAPRIVGGGQELERRAGTQDVAGVVGMAAALRSVQQELLAGEIEGLRQKRDALQERITTQHADIVVHSRGAPRLAGHLHLTIPGCLSEELLMLLDREGVCASAGAACSSGAPRASHVLLAMGVSETDARGALRLTLSTSTTDQEVDRVGEVVSSAISRLRGS